MKGVLRVIFIVVIAFVLLALIYFFGGSIRDFIEGDRDEGVMYDSSEFLENIPQWEGLPFCYVNDNVPEFSKDEIWDRPQEVLSSLDRLGRCGTAMSCIGQETMPEGQRGNISSVIPSGWSKARYDFIEGGNLFNRCHLIGWQLSGDDAIDRNLITGTEYMNREGMLPFENAIAGYVRESGNHVMYRVSPVFSGDELVSRGVRLEAVSVEDGGEGISFNVFCYNAEPGVEISYSDGRSSESEDKELLEKYRSGCLSVKPAFDQPVSVKEIRRLRNSMSEPEKYVLNMNTGKFHLKDCESIRDMNEANRRTEVTSREDLLIRGFTPCSKCRP